MGPFGRVRLCVLGIKGRLFSGDEVLDAIYLFLAFRMLFAFMQLFRARYYHALLLRFLVDHFACFEHIVITFTSNFPSQDFFSDSHVNVGLIGQIQFIENH